MRSPALSLLTVALFAACGSPPTYTVGGSVTNLLGSGLTLELNDSDTLTLDGGTASVDFTTELEEGDAYTVAITAQPTTPAQVCTLSGASGTVGESAPSITVDCVTETVDVSGTVDGLVTGGLTLQLNGTDDLSVDAEGAFAFDGLMDDGADFSVTVSSEPAGQVCEVIGGEGTADGAVSGIEVVCACAWTDGRVGNQPVLVAESNNNGVLAYAQLNMQRGFEATFTAQVSCGDVEHTLFTTGEAPPDPPAGGWNGAVLASIVEFALTEDNTVSALANVYAPGGTASRSEFIAYTASAPDWTPERVLSTGDIVDGSAVNRIETAATGGGTFASRVRTNATGSGEGIAITRDGTTELALLEGDTIGSGDNAFTVCTVGDPVVTSDGVVVVTVRDADACVNIGGVDSALVAIDTSGEARVVSQRNDDAGTDGFVWGYDSLHITEAGHVIAAEWLCPADGRCLVDPGRPPAVTQVDLTDDTLDRVAQLGDAVGSDALLAQIDAFTVSANGFIALTGLTVSSTCVDECPYSAVSMLWDGSLHAGVTAGDALGDWIAASPLSVAANDAGQVLTHSELVLPRRAVSNPYSGLTCWDSAGGTQLVLGGGALAPSGEDIAAIDSTTFNERGQWTAVAREVEGEGIAQLPMLISGTCP